MFLAFASYPGGMMATNALARQVNPLSLPSSRWCFIRPGRAKFWLGFEACFLELAMMPVLILGEPSLRHLSSTGDTSL
jgi:hypothetical protein